MVYNYDDWLLWGGFLAFVLLVVFTAGHGYSTLDGLLSFFSPTEHPRIFISYTIVTLVPLFFFKYLRGSLFVFIAFFILSAHIIATS